ncbi:MAG: cobaltochelatase subunit CobN [Microcoleaceae cyanobacterium]
MHRLAAVPGGWNPGAEGVIFIEQTPAPIVILTAADTEILTLAGALEGLPEGFPKLRVANLLQLQQQLTIDTYAQSVLEQAEVIVVRLLGGRGYWSYGLEVVQETVERTGKQLIVLPGDDRPDPNLISHSTTALPVAHQLWQYLIEGGIENYRNALKFLAKTCLNRNYTTDPPIPIPRIGVYPWSEGRTGNCSENPDFSTVNVPTIAPPTVGILFYRAHYLSGNTTPIQALCDALGQKQLNPLPIFVSSLRDPEVQAELLTNLQSVSEDGVQLLIDTTSFSISSMEEGAEHSSPLFSLKIPILQAILSSSPVEQWQQDFQGLSPRDIAMNVALPEVDGRIITRAISFKAIKQWNADLETDVVSYVPVADRVEFVAELARNWIRLQQTPVSQRRIALILANYPNRDGRLANGVGLDTPNSCIEILKALDQAGYEVDSFPQTGDELMQQLTAGVTNDPEGKELRPINQHLSSQQFQTYFSRLPAAVQQQIQRRWQGIHPNWSNLNSIPISGLHLGNIFIGIQPARGYDLDPSLNYHAPDLEPTPEYLAFYYWLNTQFEADAIVHVGKHGNLEWLPGKSIALSATCYPEIALGAMPHFYPFIVNDPGEGSQAKRRSQAVILDHLTPPMTRAELYGALNQLERLVDEYYQAQSLNPSRLSLVRDQIIELMKAENLDRDLNLNLEQLMPEKFGGNSGEMLHYAALMTSYGGESSLQESPKTSVDVLGSIDGYLCELKEAQIRDGLHIFGQCPQGEQLRDLIIAIARNPGVKRMGLTRAIAQDWQLSFDPLTTDFAERFSPKLVLQGKECYIIGDAVEQIEQSAADLVEKLIQGLEIQPGIGQNIRTELHWIQTQLLPKLQQTHREIFHLLQGLNGEYVPSGASGAPTRGRTDVLPTGRNFYSVDIRGIPTETAWSVGQLAAAAVIERYTQENGEYPKTLGLSVWGTSTMRTGGDDIAEALALLGVKPVWQGTSRRVVDFEILPLSILGRPRVDVTLRISGFFRDAFPNLIDLFDQAVIAVAHLDEPADQNPLAAQVQQETQSWITAGLSPEAAAERSCYRIFGSKPGAYGAGLQGLIEAQNWTTDEDLARAYINWSSYAYHQKSYGISASEAFGKRLEQMQIALHNQDNREHDLLDSDDYYQFQGGMAVAVRALTGQHPQTYFGDHSRPENPKVRLLREEIAKVYRSRVINPKWIAGVMRHGYKGAFEMAATVDYLFAYDVTANCVEDFMYTGVANAYVLDDTVQQFVQSKNPWALRDMAERLLEAHQRGLWQNVNSEMLNQLRDVVHQAEGAVESRPSRPNPYPSPKINNQ